MANWEEDPPMALVVKRYLGVRPVRTSAKSGPARGSAENPIEASPEQYSRLVSSLKASAEAHGRGSHG